MKVEVICNLCSSELQELYVDDSKTVLMEIEGPLFINKEHKIETQGYKCSRCKNQISVSIKWSNYETSFKGN